MCLQKWLYLGNELTKKETNNRFYRLTSLCLLFVYMKLQYEHEGPIIVGQRVQEKKQLGQKRLEKNDKNVNNLFLVRLVGFPRIHLTATKNAFLWAP